MDHQGCAQSRNAQEYEDLLSNHEGIGMPILSDTGWIGAFGRTNRTCDKDGRCESICATSDQPALESPSPWRKKRVAVGLTPERGLMTSVLSTDMLCESGRGPTKRMARRMHATAAAMESR